MKEASELTAAVDTQVVPEIIWNEPMAVMVYANGRRAAVVSEDEVGEFKLDHFDIPVSQDFNPVEGRVKRLDDFESVVVHHVPVSQARFTTEDDIIGESTVYVKFASENSDEDDNYIPGDEIFNFLVGKNGGLLAFEGQRRPPQAAILLPGRDNSQTADVLFFHSNSMEGLDSSAGMELFFKSLADNIASLVTDRQGADRHLIKYIREFEEAIREGEIPYKSSAALQIYRAIMMAHVRLYDLTLSEEHRDFLRSQFTTRWELRRNASPDVSAVVKAIEFKEPFIKPIEPPKPPKPPTPPIDEKALQEVVDKLQNPRLAELRVKVAEYFGSINEIMERYLTEIYSAINLATDPTDLDDVSVLLNEISLSSFSEDKMYFLIGTKKIHIAFESGDIDGWSVEYGKGRDVVSALRQKAQEKREKLDLERF
jgi:hypothetical protein